MRINSGSLQQINITTAQFMSCRNEQFNDMPINRIEMKTNIFSRRNKEEEVRFVLREGNSVSSYPNSKFHKDFQKVMIAFSILLKFSPSFSPSKCLPNSDLLQFPVFFSFQKLPQDLFLLKSLPGFSF